MMLLGWSKAQHHSSAACMGALTVSRGCGNDRHGGMTVRRCCMAHFVDGMAHFVDGRGVAGAAADRAAYRPQQGASVTGSWAKS